MDDRPELEPTRQVPVSAKGELMRPVQGGIPRETQGVTVVQCRDNEILIRRAWRLRVAAPRILEPRQSIRKLEIGVLNSPNRIRNVTLQLYVHRIVNAAPDGKQKRSGTNALIDAAKGARTPQVNEAGPDPQIARRIQAIPGVVDNRCPFTNGAVDGSCARSWTAECAIRRRDRCQRRGLVQETHITRVFGIYTEEIVQTHLANVVHSQHQARPEFVLHADIHLDRAWRLVGGRKRAERDRGPIRN